MTGLSVPDLGEYCRAVEAHLCQVNGGHLIRIVGPAFDLVKRWHAEGLPLRIVQRGIDRRAERAARSSRRSGTRRPLRLEFCEADVLDVFDEWRRAIGFALHSAAVEPAGEPSPGAATGPEAGGVPGQAGTSSIPSLPRHLDRVATRLTSCLASATDVSPALRATVTDTLAEVEKVRLAGPVRGGARHAALARLQALDERLLEALASDAPPAMLAECRLEARRDLEPYRGRVPASEFDRLVERSARRLVRSRLQLPELGTS